MVKLWSRRCRVRDNIRPGRDNNSTTKVKLLPHFQNPCGNTFSHICSIFYGQNSAQNKEKTAIQGGSILLYLILYTLAHSCSGDLLIFAFCQIRRIPASAVRRRLQMNCLKVTQQRLVLDSLVRLPRSVRLYLL